MARARAKVLMSKMKEDAGSQLAATRNILGTHLEQVPAPVMAHLPKKNTLERNIRNARSKGNLPVPDPMSRDFEIPEEFNDFVFHDTGRDDPNRILAFADAEVLAHVNREEWFGDGTFDKVPCQYFQLYTLHCKMGYSYPPFLYFLLPNKTTETYKRMFQIVKDLVPAVPTKLLLDFEKGAHTAFNSIFPEVTTTGCFFHLRQSVHRKVQELGLKQRHDQDMEFAHLVKCITALSFVPPDDAEALFES